MLTHFCVSEFIVSCKSMLCSVLYTHVIDCGLDIRWKAVLGEIGVLGSWKERNVWDPMGLYSFGLFRKEARGAPTGP